MPTHKEKYKSVQVNISRDKYSQMIQWLEEKAIEDATSFNSIIIRALIKEWKRDEKTND